MSSGKIRVGIIGGAGYTGGEALRILLNHPFADIAFVQSRSQAGKAVTSIHRDLTGDCDLQFSEAAAQADALILCIGHGESRKYLLENPSPGTRIIDLSQDFRIAATAEGFVYGLPELNREKIGKAKNVANPGCFATAIQLGLLPLAAKGILGTVHTTAITGSTGAGQKLQESTHFTWRDSNISAYKTLNHQHLAEIRQSLISLQPGFSSPVNFVPWRGDFTRGIYATSVTESALSLDELNTLYRNFYAGHPFTHVVDGELDMKMAVNTNKCLIRIEKSGNTIAIHAVIDNLLKGAAGQAIQNLNLMFGFPEDAGLRLKANAF